MGSDTIGFADDPAGQAGFTLIEDPVIDDQENLIAVDVKDSRICKVSYQ